MCLTLGFERLVTIDIVVYGSSVMLEFVALAVLRFREPNLPRPFRVPGGTLGAVAVGVPPLLLMGFAISHSQHEQIFGVSSFWVAIALIVAGVVAYFLNATLRPQGWSTPIQTKTEPAV